MKAPVSAGMNYEGMPFEALGRVSNTDLFEAEVNGRESSSHCHGGPTGDDPGIAVSRGQLDAFGLRCEPDVNLLSPLPFNTWVHQFLRQVLSSKIKFPLRDSQPQRPFR